MSWTLDKATGLTNIDTAMVEYDGKLAYSSVLDLKVMTWDGITQTEIWDFAGITSSAELIVFGGELFAACRHSGTSEITCYKYSGTPGNWSLVNTIGTGSTATDIRTDDVMLVQSCGRVIAPATRLSMSSGDGSSWSTDTFLNIVYRGLELVATDTDIYLYAEETSGGNQYFYIYNGGVYSISSIEMTAANLAIPIMFKGGFSALYSRRTTDNAIMRSTDGGQTWNSTALTAVYQYLWHDYYDWLDINDGNLRRWSATGWVVFDSIPLGSAIGAVCIRAGRLYIALGANIYVHDTFITVKKAYSVGGLSPASMDVSADDYYLYVGALLSGNPVLLRLLADVSADPTAVYDPGAGTAINVRCGEQSSDWTWISGDFGGPLVRVSIDDGATWTTKDPGTWVGTAQPIRVGPDDDNRVLVPSDGDDDLHETLDGGLTWTTLNAGLPFDVGGFDRLDVNPNEIMLGDIASRELRYTPNAAGNLYDISDAAMPNVGITDVIVG